MNSNLYMEMEDKIYLSNTFTIENAAEDSDFLNISGYACKYNQINLNGEMTDAKSFDTFFRLHNDGKLPVYLNWEHTDTTIGGIDEITSEADGLFVKAHLTKGVAIVRDMIAPLVISGDLNSFSTEGRILNGYDGIVELPNGNFYVKDFILVGVSIVRTPACPEAKFTLANYVQEYRAQKEEDHKKIRWSIY